MAKTKKKTVKGREGLESQLPISRRRQKLPKGLHFHSAEQDRYFRWRHLKHDGKWRRQRIRDSILGRDRVFAATVVTPSEEDARENDSVRLKDIEDLLKAGRAVVYWVDGSLGGEGHKHGVLGAGVVCQDGQQEYSMACRLGRFTGGPSDAELFAIAAALGRAKQEVEKGRKLELVRIYSDAKHILEALLIGSLTSLGPMLCEKTALQGMYDRADWLVAQGIAIQLVWVKGHSCSEGNNLADREADRAVVEQAAEFATQNPAAFVRTRKVMTDADVPDMFKKLGQDWADEWLVRANKDINGFPEKGGQLDISTTTPLGEAPDDIDEQPASEDGSNAAKDLLDIGPHNLTSLDKQLSDFETNIQQRTNDIKELKRGIAELEERREQMISELEHKETDQTKAQSEHWSLIQERLELWRQLQSQEDTVHQVPNHTAQARVVHEQIPFTPANVEVPKYRNPAELSLRPASGSNVYPPVAGLIENETYERDSTTRTRTKTPSNELYMNDTQLTPAPYDNAAQCPLLLDLRRSYDARESQIADLQRSIVEAETESGREFLVKEKSKLELEQSKVWKEIAAKAVERPGQNNASGSKNANEKHRQDMIAPENEAFELDGASDKRWVGDLLLSLLGDINVHDVQAQVIEKSVGPEQGVTQDHNPSASTEKATLMQEGIQRNNSTDTAPDDDSVLAIKSDPVAKMKTLDSRIDQLQTATQCRKVALINAIVDYDISGSDRHAERLSNLRASQSYDEQRIQGWKAQRDALEVSLQSVKAGLEQEVDLVHDPADSTVRVTSLDKYPPKIPVTGATNIAASLTADVDLHAQIAVINKVIEKQKRSIKGRETEINRMRIGNVILAKRSQSEALQTLTLKQSKAERKLRNVVKARAALMEKIVQGQ